MRTRQAIVSQNQRNFLNHFFFCDFRLWPQRISDSAEGVDEAQAMFFSIFFSNDNSTNIFFGQGVPVSCPFR